jgi:hypothetical protein
MVAPVSVYFATIPSGSAIVETAVEVLSDADALAEGETLSVGVEVSVDSVPLPRESTIAPSAKIPITTANTMRLELPDLLAGETGLVGDETGAEVVCGLLSILFVFVFGRETGTGGTTTLLAAARFAGAFFATFLTAAFLATFLATFLAGAFFATFFDTAFLATFFAGAFLATFLAAAFLATFFVAT